MPSQIFIKEIMNTYIILINDLITLINDLYNNISLIDELTELNPMTLRSQTVRARLRMTMTIRVNTRE